MVCTAARKAFIGEDGKLHVWKKIEVQTEKCPKCGQPVPVGQLICENCGTNMRAVNSGT